MWKIRRTQNNLHVPREAGIGRNTDAVNDQLIITAASCSFPRALTPNYRQFEPERQPAQQLTAATAVAQHGWPSRFTEHGHTQTNWNERSGGIFIPSLK